MITLETDLTETLSDLQDSAQSEVVDALAGLLFFHKTRDLIPKLEAQSKEARAGIKDREKAIKEAEGAIEPAKAELAQVLKDHADTFRRCEEGQLRFLSHERDQSYQLACLLRSRAKDRINQAQSALEWRERELTEAKALAAKVENTLTALRAMVRPAIPVWLSK